MRDVVAPAPPFLRRIVAAILADLKLHLHTDSPRSGQKSHKIARIPLDFAAKTSVCGATTIGGAARKPLSRNRISSPPAPSGLRGVAVVTA
jgi:hypothetical protein